MLKNLFITLGLTGFLLVFALFVFMPQSAAQNSILPRLIDIPAPPPPNPLVINVSTERSPEFYLKDNPPPDDAPIEDLLEYWKMQKGETPLEYTIVPSPRVLQRLIEELNGKPELVGEYLSVLSQKPEAVDLVKRIYDQTAGDGGEQNYSKSTLKNWLTYNSDYFSDDLLQGALEVRDADEYVTNQEQLLALARVDWDKARPLLDRMLNDSTQPVSRTLANWAYYLHALRRGNSIEAGNYRDALMRVVEDKSALPGNRDLAFDALVYGGDFPGRDDWYFDLLEDETLHDLRVNGRSYTGLTTLLLREPPGKYVDKMIELVKSKNPNVRNAAIRNIMSVLRNNDREKVKAVITALLPWLENPDWAKQFGGERMQIVQGLAQVEIPESVTGLIAALNEKTTIDINVEGNYNSNVPMPPRPPLPRYAGNVMVSNRATPGDFEKREVYPLRDGAIFALIMQKSIQAAAALRQVLPEVEPYRRDDVIKAILVSGGFTIPEQIEGLELYARDAQERQVIYQKQLELANAANTSSDDFPANYSVSSEAVAGRLLNANAKLSYRTNQPPSPTEIQSMLGRQIATITEPGGELVSAVLSRIKYLDINDPPIAEIFRSVMENWSGDAVYAILLDDLGTGKSSLDAIVKLLSLRKTLRQNQIRNIYDARAKGNPIAYGISACLLEDGRDYDAILSGAADDVKIAMLGCARLIRAQLQIQAVSPLLKNSNKLLALAAERYIESEDSPAARQIIYSLYPNQTKITGAKFFFEGGNNSYVNPNFLMELFGSVAGFTDLPPYYYYVMMGEDDEPAEAELKKELKEDEKLTGVYAYDRNYIRIYQDKAVFSWEEDDARYNERKLNESEFSYLKSYLASNDVGNLPPFISNCGECSGKELLMLGKQGGRRIFVHSNPMPKFFEGLESIFSDMKRPPATLKYWLEKDIAGAQILLADKDLEAKAVWKNGDDLRVLVNNTKLEEQIENELNKLYGADSENENLDYEKVEELNIKRRAEREFASFSWHQFSDGKLGGFVNQPTGVDFIKKSAGGFKPKEYRDEWTVSSGNVEIRMVDGELLKIVNGQKTTLKTGYYRDAVISDGGKWVVLSKSDYENDSKAIVRINLQTNREFPVKLDVKHRFLTPVSFISNANKVLINTGNQMDYADRTIKNGSYFLLDPETGASQVVKGEFRPITQQTFRPLQKTLAAGEVWAAIPDEMSKKTQVGKYNMKTFVFTSLVEVPQISFTSMQMWVDEPQNKVFIVYNGQLLSIPLKTAAIAN